MDGKLAEFVPDEAAKLWEFEPEVMSMAAAATHFREALGGWAEDHDYPPLRDREGRSIVKYGGYRRWRKLLGDGPDSRIHRALEAALRHPVEWPA